MYVCFYHPFIHPGAAAPDVAVEGQADLEALPTLTNKHPPERAPSNRIPIAVFHFPLMQASLMHLAFVLGLQHFAALFASDLRYNHNGGIDDGLDTRMIEEERGSFGR